MRWKTSVRWMQTIAREPEIECVEIDDGCLAIRFAEPSVELGLIAQPDGLERAVWLIVDPGGEPIYVADAFVGRA